MTKRDRVVPEFRVRTKRTRAGFVPTEYDHDVEVELVQFWCKNAETGNEWRATDKEVRAAGLRRAVTKGRKR